MKEFIPPKPLETSVLFLIFNRLDTTQQVFEAIKKAKPPRLYIASDGPRDNKEGEKETVKKVRKYVLDNIDWDCEVKTLFREKNLGCKMAVSSAITWFFENEEQGIILEDDCLPSQSFFWYCEELLNRYKNDMRIWHIGGYKHKDLPRDNFDYNFSKFTQVWGWATWSDRWKLYDVKLNLYKSNKKILFDYEFFTQYFVNLSRKKILDRLINNEIDTWDYQWNFCVRVNNGLAIRPSVNLIKNIGFGENATHTTTIDDEIIKNSLEEINIPLKHPNLVMIFKKADDKFANRFKKNNLLKRIKRKLF